MTFYINIERVMKRKRMFITWVHNGVNVKYLPCAFEGIYVLNFINMPKDFLYESIHGDFTYTIHMTTLAQYDHWNNVDNRNV